MKVSKKFLVKDKTSMDVKIVVPSKVIPTNNGKKGPAKIDTGKSLPELFFLQNIGTTCCVHNMFSPGLSLEFFMY